MGILEGKNILVAGVTMNTSIGYRVVELAQAEGANVVVSNFGRAMSLTERVLRRLSEDVPWLRSGNWVKYAGVKGRPVRAAALECQIHQTSDLLVDLALTSTRTNLSLEVLTAPRSFVKGKRRASLDRTGEQLVAAADEVLINGKAIPFSKLQKEVPGALEPVTLDGTPVTGFFVFGGISEAELARLGGTKVVASFNP